MQQRERHKSGTDVALPGSPNQALTFDKKPFCEYFPLFSISSYSPPPTLPASRDESQDDDEPYYTKTRSSDTPQTDPEFATEPRQRASTMSEGTVPKPNQPEPVFTTDPIKKDALPTVFKWDGGGKQVFISGTFSNWKALPMVRSHGDFVTIIDLPEGDHQYKFCVDGEWKHDPKLVREEQEPLICNSWFTM